MQTIDDAASKNTSMSMPDHYNRSWTHDSMMDQNSFLLMNRPDFQSPDQGQGVVLDPSLSINRGSYPRTLKSIIPATKSLTPSASHMRMRLWNAGRRNMFARAVKSSSIMFNPTTLKLTSHNPCSIHSPTTRNYHNFPVRTGCRRHHQTWTRTSYTQRYAISSVSFSQGTSRSVPAD
jgi:hypothetical protein